MEGGEWRDDLRGTPQGAIVSPILANVYLHYVLDLWFHKKWRARTAEGNTIIVRYADDFVVGFQYQRDAERFLHASHWSCTLTKPVSSSSGGLRKRTAGHEASGVETFDLGAAERRGREFGLGRKPVGKRVDRTLRRIGAELRPHHNPYEVAKWLGKILNGWLHYTPSRPVPRPSSGLHFDSDECGCVLETPVATGPSWTSWEGSRRLSGRSQVCRGRYRALVSP